MQSRSIFIRAPRLQLYPAAEVAVHRSRVTGSPAGRPPDGHEGLAVGFAGGGEAQVHASAVATRC